MKRLLAAALLTLIVAAIHFCGNTYIKKVIRESTVLVDECIDEYRKDISPREKADKLQEYWANNEDYLSIFARHDNIDEIELAIDTLAVYAETKDSEIFYEYSGTVKTLLHQLYEDNSFSMHSIL